MTPIQTSTWAPPKWRTFQIPKKNGKTRTICDPGQDHRRDMRQFLSREHLEKYIEEMKAVHEIGFLPQHAAPMGAVVVNWRRNTHPILIQIDLRDFFPSIKRRRARRIAGKIWGDKELGSAATLNGRLAQGHPLAPVIANSASHKAKEQICNVVRKYEGYVFSYADDITVAVKPGTRIKELIQRIDKILRSQGLERAQGKTKVVDLRRRPTNVLGVVLHPDGTTRPSRKVRRQIRALLHAVLKAEDPTSHPLARTLAGLLNWAQLCHRVASTRRHTKGSLTLGPLVSSLAVYVNTAALLSATVVT